VFNEELLQTREWSEEMKGWLVNDCLTCIPDTKTFWHDLLEWFPDLHDMTMGKQGFGGLAEYVEMSANAVMVAPPDYIIRNASYFRRLNLPVRNLKPVRIISYLQDCLTGSARTQQLDVCNHSDVVVCNSPFIKGQYEKEIHGDVRVIPIGTNFNLFRPLPDKLELRRKWDIRSDTILFVGSTHSIKGFDKILHLMDNTSYNFCLVMKDDFKYGNPRVKVFNRISHESLVEIINCCAMLVCASTTETLHLAGVEAMACGVPVLTTDVGIYHGLPDGLWGRKVKDGDFRSGIRGMFSGCFNPREFALNNGWGSETCRLRWINLIGEGK
jgi:glycosyltransferase involved in cell wall biosynthesis